MKQAIFFGLNCVHIIVFHVFILGLELLLFTDLQLHEHLPTLLQVLHILEEILIHIKASFLGFFNPFFTITIPVESDCSCLLS